MATCPFCAEPLTAVPQREGVYYHCSRCQGRALTVPQLRRVAGDALASRLMRLMKLTRQKGRLPCAFCAKAMFLVSLADPQMEVEVCPGCNGVWLDAPSYELLPNGVAVTTNALPLLSTQIFAETRLKEQQDREREAEKRKGKRRRSSTAES